MNNTSNIDNNINNIGILDPEGLLPNPLTNQPYSDAYKDMAKMWSGLPAYENARQIIEQIKLNQVILVVSGTGSGKTVLFPKYVLHAFNYNAKIAITLPKQMITKNAATYAAATLDVKVGEEVGYQYRGAGKHSSPKTKLLYCTDGTLVARLSSDPKLMDFDAVLIDEAHERKMNIDLLLFLLKNVLKSRPEFKLVIMSATINEEIFRSYYKDFKYVSLSIGTKSNYLIKSVFLDKNINDKEYIEVGTTIIKDLLTVKDKNQGGILFFVTSVRETEDTCDSLQTDKSRSNICVPVFSGMNEEEQKKATDKDYYKQFVAESGIKIIVATNVAESSLTINGITDVIDCGLELKSRFDPISRIHILEKGFITNAQARQRMGRTGRTSPGTCYHLYTKQTFDNEMDKFPLPAIRTESISNEILRLMCTLPNTTTIDAVKKTLNEFIEPPTIVYVDAEIRYLFDMHLVTSDKADGIVTSYGQLVSDLNMEPSDAISLAIAYKLNCFREVLAVVCVVDVIGGSIDKLFTLPTDISDDDRDKNTDRLKHLTKKFNAAKERFSNRYGDHLAILKIFSEFEKNRKTRDDEKLKDWSYKYFIDRYILDRAYQNYVRLKQRLRPYLQQFNSSDTDPSLLNSDIKYKVLASFMFGYHLNLLKVDSKGLIKTDDSKVRNIQLEKNNFIDRELKSSDKLFYNNLYRYNTNPVSAKIVSLLSQKGLEIIKQLK